MIHFYYLYYYSVCIMMVAETEADVYCMDTLKQILKTEKLSVMEICSWCMEHHIQYGIQFRYRKYERASFWKNVKNFIHYLSLKKSKLLLDSKNKI